MTLIIGVDVAKFFSSYTILDSNGSCVVPTFDSNNDVKGLEDVLEKIKKAANGSKDNHVLIMESTGYFSNRLRDYFTSHELNVLEINPLISNSIRNISVRKVKNDHADSYDLANLYLTGKLNKLIQKKLTECIPLSQDYMRLRVLTRARQKLSKQRTTQVMQLVADVEQVLPTYKKLFKDMACKSSLATLELICKPEMITYDSFYSTLKVITPCRGQAYFTKYYDKLIDILDDAKIIGRKVETFFITIKIHVSLILEYDKYLARLEEQIHELSQDLDSVRLLKSIPGIGGNIAPAIASEIGDISRFKNVKALVAFCGLDPGVKQSGQYNRLHNKISKRGAPELRRALYMAAMLSITKMKNGHYRNKVLYDYYQELILKKPRKVALGAIMHKLVRIIFSVLKNQQEFIMITPEQQRKLYQNNLSIAI
jgi:transposase